MTYAACISRSYRPPGSILCAEPLYSHQWVPESQYHVLVGGGAQGRVSLFDARKSSTPLAVLREPMVESIGAISVHTSKGRDSVFIALSGTGFALWEMRGGGAILERTAVLRSQHGPSYSTTAAFLPDLPLCAIASGSGCISFVNAEVLAT